MSDSLIRLLDALFSSILDDRPWINFLEALERDLPGHFSTMVLRKPRVGDPGVLISAERNAEAVMAVQTRVFKESAFLELPLGQICILSEMFTERELKEQFPDYYNFMRSYGNAADLIGVDLQEASTGMIFRLRCARLTGEPRFGKRERKILETLLPRLEIAIALYARIALQQYQLSVSDEAVDQLAIGTMVLNESGEVLLKNAMADQLLVEGDGFYLRDGILRCTDSRSEREFRRQLAAIITEAGDARTAAEPSLTDASPAPQSDSQPLECQVPNDRLLKIQRGQDGRFWSVLLRPSVATVGLHEKTSITVRVLVRDASQQPEISSAMLMELFGMTRAEAMLAELLVKGESLSDAAAMLGRSRYTARAQLASIFTKTDIHRQSQLVSHILNTVNTVWT